MTLVRSDEQDMLARSVGRLFAESLDESARTRAARNGTASDVWRNMAELGLFGLPFQESDGGFGGSAGDVSVVMEEIGRAGLATPYRAGIVEVAALRQALPEAGALAALVPAIVAGEHLVVPAHHERQARWDLTDVACRAEPDGTGWRLSGAKALVPAADVADHLIVSARTGGQRRDPDGIALFLVPRTAPGVAMVVHPTQDGARAGEVTLTEVILPADARLCGPGEGAAALVAMRQAALAALAAEAVGAMAAALDMTVEYLKTRQQFGVTLGAFQALQHRCADMYVALELARSMTRLAAAAMDAGPSAGREAVLAAAKAEIGRAGRFIGENAVQLHGGIGVTAEYRVGHLFKRLVMIDAEHGSADWHRARLAAGPSLIGG